MKNKKLCCRIFPVVLIILSTIIGIAIWYFEEGVYSFSFLTDKDEVFNFIGSVLFISILPIAIFYYLVEKEKYETRARQLALLGFIPALLFFLFIIFV